MARPRKKLYQQLPKYVYVERKRLVYKEPGAKAVTIGPSDMPLADVWREHQKLTTQDDGSLGYIKRQYYGSERFKSLKSKKEVERNLDKVLSLMGDGMMPEQIKPVTIRDYLDARNDTPVAANREMSAFSAMWNWAREYGHIDQQNPCKGVRKHTEKAKDDLVTEVQYQAIYKIMPPHIQVAMELAYLCRMRTSECLDTRVKDIEEDGLNTRRLKGSDDALTLWSPRLEKAVNQGLQGCIRTPEMTIVNINGSPVRRSSFQTTWQRRIIGNPHRFAFHDLKAAGVSDFEGDKKAASGHKTDRMVSVYDRKRKVVNPTK